MEPAISTHEKVLEKVIQWTSNSAFRNLHPDAFSLLSFFSQNWENTELNIVKEKLQKLSDATKIKTFDIDKLSDLIANTDIDKYIKLGHTEEALKLLELFIRKSNPHDELMEDGLFFAQKYYIYHRPDLYDSVTYLNLDINNQK